MTRKHGPHQPIPPATFVRLLARAVAQELFKRQTEQNLPIQSHRLKMQPFSPALQEKTSR